jgi:hypothetical protein
MGKIFILNSNYLDIKDITIERDISLDLLDPMPVALTTINNTQGCYALMRSGELLDLKTRYIVIT